MFKKIALGIASVSLIAGSLHAANLASDNASNSPYQPGNNWPTGSNGGTGFGPWSFAATGTADRYIGASGVGQDPSFGIFASNTTDTSSADRSFTGGALTAGQTFSLQLGASGVASGGGVVGLNLLDGTTPVFTFKFTGGGTVWALNDGGTDFDTNIPFSANTGISLAFTYNGGQSYTINISQGPNTFSGPNFTANSTISNITGFRMFSNLQGVDENLGFNNLAVVPEPTTLSLLAGPALLGAWFFIRRRRA